MTALAQPSAGWFQDRKAVSLGVAFITLASLPGTGGTSDSHFWLKRQARGYSVPQFQGIEAEAGQLASTRTPAENLARVRDILKPAVSDLAAIFGVSRQTIYNWQAGEEPKPEYAARLEDFAKAADVIAAEGIRQQGQLLKRRVAGGQNLLDVMRSGGSAYELVHQLVQIVRREDHQRKAIDARLAGRKRKTIDYAEIGVPHLDEKA